MRYLYAAVLSMFVLGTMLAEPPKPPGKGPAVGPAVKIAPPKRDPRPMTALIDELIQRQLQQEKLPPSPLANDAEFLRRVTLDLTGRIPSYQRTVAFLASKDPDKRRNLIEELLASAAYGEHFATVWRNLIVPREEGAGDKPVTDLLGPWLAAQFNAGRGWNEIVAELLKAEGVVNKTPQATFLMANAENFQPQPSRLADATSRLFWGVQLRCAECHDHPFAQWKQDEFWATAAFFGRVRHSGFKGKVPPFVSEVIDAKTGPEIAIPATSGKNAGKLVKARFLDGALPKLSADGPFRPALAAWATSADNPYFARAAVNRWWAQFFGRGFVQPLDGYDESNQPSHPELHEKLARDLAASGFDVKHLCRVICNSQAYQRSSRPLTENESDKSFFSHQTVRALSPEAFYDSVAMIMAADRNTGKGPLGQMEKRSTFVRAFRPLIDADEAVHYTQGIPQVLKLLNTPILNGGAPIVATVIKGNKAPAEGIEAVYLTALSRRPTESEKRLMSEYLAQQSNPREGYAGVLWILLNSSEFALNR
jgi:hypothetical protein